MARPKPTLMSLPPELLDMIISLFDMASLLSWRETCTRNKSYVNVLLHEARDRIIGYYIPDVSGFLDLLDEFNAVIAGNAALAFFLRDDLVLDMQLDVSVGLYQGPEMEEALTTRFNCTATHGGDDELVSAQWPVKRRFSLPTYSFLMLHISNDDSPITPIAKKEISAQINYVSPHSFGCAYAALTLRRRAFCPESFCYVHRPQDTFDRDSLVNRCGFIVSHDPRDLVPEDVPRLVGTWGNPCFRSQYVCPAQERWFGDGGSLVDFFDNSPAAIEALRLKRGAPFGTTTVWRLHIYADCFRECRANNYHLALNPGIGYLSAVHEPFRSGPQFTGVTWS